VIFRGGVFFGPSLSVAASNLEEEKRKISSANPAYVFNRPVNSVEKSTAVAVPLSL